VKFGPLSVPGIRPSLVATFGLTPRPRRTTYVDRGGLDQQIKDALAQRRPIVIYGESQLGKSWLFRRIHGRSPIARVRCQPGSTARAVLEEALGSIRASKPGEASKNRQRGVAAKGISLGRSKSTSSIPVGQDPQYVTWVAGQLRWRWFRRRRLLVLEDFHNLGAEEQRTLAFLIKALFEDGVGSAVLGIWPEGNLLTHHCGELSGRIVEVRPGWSGDELGEVLDNGCRSLRVRIDPPLRQQLVALSRGSVGLLQELAFEFLRSAGVRRRALRGYETITDEAHLETAVNCVLASCRSRFDQFLVAFAEGDLDGDPEANGIYRAMLLALMNQIDDQKVRKGVTVKELLSEVAVTIPGLQEGDLRRALQHLPQLHRQIAMHPAVFVFEPSRDRVFLADRRLEFYRLYGQPKVR
jgi:hypothetical protein